MAVSQQFNHPPAIVVGVCGHGLSLIHALAEASIPVIALEANPQLPGTRTKHAHIEHVTDINGLGLIASLQSLAQRLEFQEKPVLFLTNDRMSVTVARHWESLAPFYHLSWAHCREGIVALLDKSNLETHCVKQGLNYPPTCLINSESDIDAAIAITGYSAIIKPSKPLAKFKTVLPKHRQDYSRLIEQCKSDLPFITQRFIPGDDTCIYFCALYLDRGKELARFDGRKLRSRPMGHSTIAEPCLNEEVYQLTLRFFEGLQLSGPVSVEFKRDGEGRYWVIEPTLGRSDFWLGLCTENKINLPLTEYRNQLNQPVHPMAQSNIAVWFNEERDPLGRVWLALHPIEKMGSRRATYLFFRKDDWRPGLQFSLSFINGLFLRFVSHLRNEFARLARVFSN